MPEINWIAVVVAAISAFMVGGLWYSPVCFAKAWMAETGITGKETDRKSPTFIFGNAFALSLIAAIVFAMFLGPHPSMQLALGAGFAAGLAWVASSLGINYLFEGKTLRLFLINGGYHVVQFTVYGLVLGLFN
ncbi:MAG: DUF1761 domain-containing protein [Pseudomonadota bacterium]